MAWSESDVTAIEKGIAELAATGVARVRFASGAETEYTSLKDLFAARDRIQGELADQASDAEPGGVVVSYSKGTC